MKKRALFVLLFFGFTLVPMVLLAGASTSLLKVSAKYGDDFAKLTAKYGDDAGKLMTKYGDDAVKIVGQHGGDGLKVLQKYGDDAVGIFSKYGDDGVKALSKYGDDALNLFKKSDGAFRVLLNHGDDALKVMSKYGDDGFKLLEKNSATCRQLVSMNVPARTATVMTRFSNVGFQKTGALLKRLEKAPTSDAEKFFQFLEKFGEAGTEFVWKNLERATKVAGDHPVGTLIAAFVAYGFTHPDQVEAGMELTGETIQHTVSVAGAVASHATEVAGAVASQAIERSGRTFSESYVLQIAVATLILVFGFAVMAKLNLLKGLFTKQVTEAPKTEFSKKLMGVENAGEPNDLAEKPKDPPWV